ncbi:OmpA family protein [Lacinutrix sp.]|uniref:OmpA family protein n=1 Tax=Lacinutrix sp. TaxID=1937692 RepID=UPI00262A0BDB|nr:OmpA family protein [Lacinutrix sp.]MDG1714353.1 OmpA family protein [Lacinutrix sp.]
MKQKITLLFLFFFGSITAQNLVLNSSFEEYIDCPRNISFFHYNVKDWSIPNEGTTDYFNSCDDKMDFKNFNGEQEANSGKGYAGIYVYSKQDYREYIQGELKEKLNKEEHYKISFYVSLAENSSFSINDFGILFMPMRLMNVLSPKVIDVQNYNKQKYKSNYVSTNKKLFYSDKENWIKIEIDYVANGFEKYFSLGNFQTNKEVIKERVVKKKGRFAYYYIDDVTVIPSDYNKEEELQPKIEEKIEEILLEPETTYTFKNVLFDFDKAELLNTSIEELDKLSIHLKENKSLNIEIYGHTDNVGLTTRNKELSLQRAKAVSEYLILKGLENERIQWFGFGNSKPVVDNTTEDNRAKNRRVEFKLINKN